MIKSTLEGSPESECRQIGLFHGEIPVREGTRKSHLAKSGDVVHHPVKSKKIDQVDINGLIGPGIVSDVFVKDAGNIGIVVVLVGITVPLVYIARNGKYGIVD